MKKISLPKVKNAKFGSVLMWFGVIAVAIAGVMLIIVATSKPKPLRYTEYDLTKKSEIKENKEKAEKQSYTSETIYDGAAVPYYLFDWEFISDEDKAVGDDSYQTNKDLSVTIGEESLQAYADQATEYMTFMYGNNAKEIAADTDAFKDKFCSFYNGGSGLFDNFGEAKDESELIDCETYADKFAELYVDNGITMKATVRTDKSLVYYKNYHYYVRGEIELTPSSNKEKGECTLMAKVGPKVSYGKTTRLPFEVEIAPTTDRYIMSSSLYQEKE